MCAKLFPHLQICFSIPVLADLSCSLHLSVVLPLESSVHSSTLSLTLEDGALLDLLLPDPPFKPKTELLHPDILGFVMFR